MKGTTKKSRVRAPWLTACFASTALVAPALAHAQTQGGETSVVQEVVVTASRAAPSGFAAPTPTTMVTSAAIERQGATNIGEALYSNPAFKQSGNPIANGTKAQNPAQATADLRGVGAPRTLVLVDGMRVVPAAATNTGSQGMVPDLNRIPLLMIDRVEVVTGGASAQWGSDAVSGVVNVILKRKVEGLTVKTEVGTSQRGDLRSSLVSVLAGHSFADDRARIVVAGDWVTNSGLRDIYSRKWGAREDSIFTNPSPATNGLPALLVLPNVRIAQSPGGLITGPANFSFRGYEFLPGGATVRPFQYGSLVNGAVMVGGQGLSAAYGIDGQPHVDRWNSYGKLEFDFTPDLTGFIQAAYTEGRGAYQHNNGRFASTTIRQDNAYLPDVVRAAMVAQNVASFTLSRINYDLGPAQLKVKTETPQIAAGLRGKLGEWTWDAHYTFGHNHLSFAVDNDPITQRFNFASDAVLFNGQIVCRATVPGAAFNAAAAGCAPINLFGDGSPSAAARAYIQGRAFSEASYDLHNAGFNVQGTPFSTWAGPVAIGAGVEWRSEKINVTADPLTQAQSFATTGNATAFAGSYNVKEGYVEAVVPLARDVAFAKSLDLNVAGRFADYSNIGSQTTWKVGGTYEPIDGLRFRTTRSRDIRAPSLSELFANGAALPQTVNVRGFTVFIPGNLSKGNPDLGPERADTFTAGVVIEPKSIIPGLQLSVDYFDIDIKDAVTNIAQGAPALCDSGNAYACSLFTFDPVTGAPTSYTTTTVNAATLQYIGYDFSARYRTNFAEGNLDLEFNGTYMTHAYVNLGFNTGRVDRAGENGGVNNGAIARFTGVFSGTYSQGKLSLTAQARYISKGHIDNTYNTRSTNTVNTNTVPDVIYVNAYGTFKLDDEGRRSLFFAVDNIFDKDPPVTPYVALFSGTNSQYYDKAGRAFRVGATISF